MKRILVIEDNVSVGELLKDVLSDSGFTVDLAPTAEIAYQAIKKNKPDLIFSDIQLPDISGFEFCAILRKRPDTRNTPILLCTAAELSQESRLKGFELGADDYIAKPFNFQEVVARINAVFRRIDTAQAEGRQAVVASPAARPASSRADVSAKAGLKQSLDIWFSALLAPRQAFSQTLSTLSLIPVLLVGAFDFFSYIAAADVRSPPAFLSWSFPLFFWLGFSWLSYFLLSLAGSPLKWQNARRIWSLAAMPLVLGGALTCVYSLVTGGSPLDFTANPALLAGQWPVNTFGRACLSQLEPFGLWAAVLAYRGLRISLDSPVLLAWGLSAGSWLCLAGLRLASWRIFSGL